MNSLLKYAFCLSIYYLQCKFSLLQNFVGMSVSDGYIATGSETNDVLVHLVTFRKATFDTFCFFGFLALLLLGQFRKLIPQIFRVGTDQLLQLKFS